MREGGSTVFLDIHQDIRDPVIKSVNNIDYGVLHKLCSQEETK